MALSPRASALGSRDSAAWGSDQRYEIDQFSDADDHNAAGHTTSPNHRQRHVSTDYDSFRHGNQFHRPRGDSTYRQRSTTPDDMFIEEYDSDHCLKLTDKQGPPARHQSISPERYKSLSRGRSPTRREPHHGDDMSGCGGRDKFGCKFGCADCSMKFLCAECRGD